MQVQVQVHEFSLCCRVVQVAGVQVQVHEFSLYSRVVQVDAGAGAGFLPVL